MDIETVKNLFKSNYSNTSCELVDEHVEELFFKTRYNDIIKVDPTDIQRYSEFESRRKDFQTYPVECSMYSKDYREQAISPVGRSQALYFSSRRTPLIFGDLDSEQLYIEIGEASDDFKDFFRFSEGFHEITLERVIRPLPRMARGNSLTLRERLHSPTTIRAYNIAASNVEQSVKRTQPLFEACLFNLSCLRHEVFSLTEEWPRRQPRKRPFQYGERESGRQLRLPKGRLNTDIIRFYQRGMSTDDPANQFLSFYQVLEYFFLTVSDEELYRKLASVVNDPAFSAKPRQLDRIIQETTTHKRESDETEMLRLVLNRYLNESELMGFIEAYEEYLEEKWYTKKRRLFGDDNEIRLAQGHVIGNVAKRVKLIRNALVHSSDRYNRQETFIPNPESESIIGKEVPLVKYLAEKVIIATSYERT